MCVELAGAVAMVLLHSSDVDTSMMDQLPQISMDLVHGSTRFRAMVALGAVLQIWASTFFLSVPCHEKLARDGFTEETVRKLIISNWMRTLVWTGRSAELVRTLFWVGLQR